MGGRLVRTKKGYFYFDIPTPPLFGNGHTSKGTFSPTPPDAEINLEVPTPQKMEGAEKCVF